MSGLKQRRPFRKKSMYQMVIISILTICFHSANSQWTETSLEFTSPGTSYTKFQLAEHTWSGSHAILFNAYKNTTVNGGLSTTGNTRYANNQGSYGGGAGAIMFFGNGGYLRFYVSPAAGVSGADTDIDWGGSKMQINRAGQVSIGNVTTPPSNYLLAVDGKAIMEEVKVEVSGSWPDHVFGEDYKLPSLSETEQFIKENKHLPGIPTAEEVQAEGIALGEMNAKLLEKIEELTLHQIELYNQVELLVEQNKMQQNEISTLKEQLK